jgi:chemosensory pili system protein ChpA (sensor histidine kinase/response regulator)
MTTGFTIDDVRVTLTRDITRALGRIEREARDVLDDPELAAASEPASLPRFVAIAEQSHAIHGTSGLVAARSLADSSARMEALAERGRDQLARAQRHLASVREIAAAMAGGATDMLAMLSLELDAQPREADAIAESWRLRVADVLEGGSLASPGGSSIAGLRLVGAPTVELRGPAARVEPAAPAPAAPPPGDAVDHGWSDLAEPAPAPAYSFAASVATAPAYATGGSVAAAARYSFAASAADAAPVYAYEPAAGDPFDEPSEVDSDLAEVFADEARATLDGLDATLAALRASPGDRSLIKAIERGFHTLKGAAATVGLAAVSARAAELQDRSELLVDAGRPVTRDEADGLIRDAAALRALAQLAVVAPPVAPVAPPVPAGELDEVAAEFEREARVALDEAEHLLGDLAEAEPAAAPALARSLGLVMHRLRGSALVTGFPALADAAASVEALAGAAPVPLDRVADELARCGTLLVAPPQDAAVQRVAIAVPDGELDPSFQQECAELLEALDRSALALERSDRPRDQLGELLRNYHTLKGVVNALGVWPIGEQLHRIEDLLEGMTAASIMPPARAIASALLTFHGEIRQQLRTVRSGYVEVVAGRLEARIARLHEAATRSTSTSIVAPAPLARTRTRASRLGEGSEAGDASAPLDRRNLRVSIDRLDALMNLTGELVINRSRLLSRVDWLRGLQVELGRSSRHVLDVVEKFRDDHEFSAVARGAGPAGAPRWSGFSELELDRYEDVNILARSLSEGSSDLHELLGQLAGGLGALANDSDALGTIVSGIQGEVTRTRMVPLDTVFSRLQLPVRDAAERERREVRLDTSGVDVHLDKTIVDALFQPLLHLVRNAVSHGIEPSAARIAAGKPAHGTVTLRARQELGQIVVEVSDDGAGLDLERLRERGVALGLVEHDTPLDDPRIRDLIFVHGLSTHATADAVAGRGVGCDVVRRAIERLNGSLRVDSVRHVHTTFAITLPVTLAISRALLVRHGGETYAVPLYFTERIIDAHDVELVESANQRRLDIDGTFVPVRGLGEFVSGPTAEDGPILLLQVGDQRLVVQVDAVVTQEEVVVKSLGALLRGHPTFAGVTIRGTGETVLILDVPSMVDSALGRAATSRPAARAPVAPVIAEPAPASDPDRPLHVLLVDDSVSVRKVAERALRSLGVHVTLATDGIDALDKLRGGQFDLVFTDLEMPRMHGYELIRELRFVPAYHALPIVVVTSRSGKKHRDEAQAVGASDYLTKPFTARSLAAALVKLCGARARDLVIPEAGA